MKGAGMRSMRKEVLEFCDLDLKAHGLDRDFEDFSRYLDRIGVNDMGAMSAGKWKKLFAMMRSLSEAEGRNYCVYRNSRGVCFDVTRNFMGMEEDIDAVEPEYALSARGSPLSRLARYKREVEWIDLKIARLRERRMECIKGKIDPLREELAAAMRGAPSMDMESNEKED